MTGLALSLPWWTYALLLCMVLGLGAWLVFLWALRTGQFKDPDGTAQAMLDADRRETALPEATPAGKTAARNRSETR